MVLRALKTWEPSYRPWSLTDTGLRWGSKTLLVATKMKHFGIELPYQCPGRDYGDRQAAWWLPSLFVQGAG